MNGHSEAEAGGVSLKRQTSRGFIAYSTCNLWPIYLLSLCKGPVTGHSAFDQSHLCEAAFFLTFPISYLHLTRETIHHDGEFLRRVSSDERRWLL